MWQKARGIFKKSERPLFHSFLRCSPHHRDISWKKTIHFWFTCQLIITLLRDKLTSCTVQPQRKQKTHLNCSIALALVLVVSTSPPYKTAVEKGFHYARTCAARAPRRSAPHCGKSSIFGGSTLRTITHFCVRVQLRIALALSALMNFPSSGNERS